MVEESLSHAIGAWCDSSAVTMDEPQHPTTAAGLRLRALILVLEQSTCKRAGYIKYCSFHAPQVGQLWGMFYTDSHQGWNLSCFSSNLLHNTLFTGISFLSHSFMPLGFPRIDPLKNCSVRIFKKFLNQDEKKCTTNPVLSNKTSGVLLPFIYVSSASHNNLQLWLTGKNLCLVLGTFLCLFTPAFAFINF